MNPKSGSKHNASKTKEKTKAKTKLTKAKTKTNGKELPPIPLEVVDLGTRELQQAGLRDVVIEVVRDFPDFEVEAKVKINHAAMLSPEECVICKIRTFDSNNNNSKHTTTYPAII